MDIATIFGILMAGALVMSAIVLGGSPAWFISVPSLMIVVGGTVGATLSELSHHPGLGVFKVVKNVFFHQTKSAVEIIEKMVEFGKLARREGILAFESRMQEIDDPFFSKGLSLAIDGMESTSIKEVLTTEILYMEDRHSLGAEIFTTMAAYAPAVGLMGTIIGLVQMLMQMDDPSKIGPTHGRGVADHFLWDGSSKFAADAHCRKTENPQQAGNSDQGAGFGRSHGHSSRRKPPHYRTESSKHFCRRKERQLKYHKS
jgi:chemotaxis protein MotA